MLLPGLLLALAASPAPGEAPTAVLEKPDGSFAERPLAELRAASLDELGAVVIAFRGLEPPADEPGGGPRVELQLARPGERVAGRVARGAGDSLDLLLAGGSVLRLGADEIRSALVPANVPAADRLDLEPAASGDRLYRRIGEGLDRLDGTLVGFSAEGVEFEGAIGRKTFAWTELAALYLESLGDPPARAPAAGDVSVDLRGGDRLLGRLAGIDGQSLRLVRGAGPELALPLAALEAVSADDGRIAYLSDLTPSGEDPAAPFGDELGIVWRHAVDRAVSGTPLRAGARAWPRGLGVHAPSKLRWMLAPGWRELRGRVALDDGVLALPVRGSVVFRVRLDGKVAWESPIVRAGDAPLVLGPVVLAGARELELEADMFTDLHAGDRADWLAAMLVR